MNEPELTVRRIPVIDTGIGREAGYANDAEFIAAANAEREKALSMLTPEGRARFEAAEARIDREILFGKDQDS